MNILSEVHQYSDDTQDIFAGVQHPEGRSDLLRMGAKQSYFSVCRLTIGEISGP
jgi:hypothetical protein